MNSQNLQSLVRIMVMAALIVMAIKFAPKMCGEKKMGHVALPASALSAVRAPDFVPDVNEGHTLGIPPEGALCRVYGSRFLAELSGRGAALIHFWILGDKYKAVVKDSRGEFGFDVSSTPDHEHWRSLRTQFRQPGSDSQMDYDRFNWTLREGGQNEGNTKCVFSYEDAKVSLTKVISSGVNPFELSVETTVKNLAEGVKQHRFDIELFAFRYNREVKGKLGRISPFLTDLACAKSDDVVRKNKGEFAEGWFSMDGVNRFVAISSSYFSQALVPYPLLRKERDSILPSAEEEAILWPKCAVFAESRRAQNQDEDDDGAATLFQAKLIYPAIDLASGESAYYKQIAFFGPKEREVLAHAAGGGPALGGLINYSSFLGLPLAPIAKILVATLTFYRTHVTLGNWGIAIILLTISLKLALLPLSIPGLKNSIKMRKIKPELDALKVKFPDDMQARMLATRELQRRHGINMVVGCLPQLATMPVWIAMYSTIQTAAEMYHTPFLWFSDLSSPDRYYILPLLLGAFMIVQQKLMPQTEMDPSQQKVMMWVMPIVFTVMMLFLPAALGVYMLTNSILGILQTFVTEQMARRAVREVERIKVKELSIK